LSKVGGFACVGGFNYTMTLVYHFPRISKVKRRVFEIIMKPQLNAN
jgi:hypothetical protein